MYKGCGGFAFDALSIWIPGKGDTPTVGIFSLRLPDEDFQSHPSPSTRLRRSASNPLLEDGACNIWVWVKIKPLGDRRF